MSLQDNYKRSCLKRRRGEGGLSLSDYRHCKNQRRGIVQHAAEILWRTGLLSPSPGYTVPMLAKCRITSGLKPGLVALLHSSSRAEHLSTRVNTCNGGKKIIPKEKERINGNDLYFHRCSDHQQNINQLLDSTRIVDKKAYPRSTIQTNVPSLSPE